MCNCPKVHFYDVDFKLYGMKVVPSCKNCGSPLSDEQAKKFEKEIMKHWGFEDKKQRNLKEFYCVNFINILKKKKSVVLDDQDV